MGPSGLVLVLAGEILLLLADAQTGQGSLRILEDIFFRRLDRIDCIMGEGLPRLEHYHYLREATF